MDAKEVREKARALREQKGRLEEELAAGEDRGLRLELARVEEELVTSHRQLRELMPKHRIRHGGGASASAGYQMDRAQYQAWSEARYAGDEEGPTPRELMQKALQESGKKLTEKQRTYFEAVAAGVRVTDVARTVGVSKSTVCRTVKRAQGHVKREATLRYQGKRWSDEGGPLCLDLSRREHLEALTGALTTKQQLYLYLYYGEWLSLREVGALLEVDKSTVLRTIRRGLERLDGLVGGSDVYLEGVEALEDLLMAHYSQLGPGDLAEPCRGGPPGREERTGWRKRGKGKGPQAPRLAWERERRVEVACGGGRLLSWLEELRQTGEGPGFVRRLLTALLEKVGKRLQKGGN